MILEIVESSISLNINESCAMAGKTVRFKSATSKRITLRWFAPVPLSCGVSYLYEVLLLINKCGEKWSNPIILLFN